MIGIHPERVSNDDRAVRWVVTGATLPVGRVSGAPGRLGEMLAGAMLSDALAEPGAVIGFAGARVIEETIREKLPEGFQRAEYLLDHGMIDRIVQRKDLAKEIGGLLKFFMNKKNRGVASSGKDLPLVPLLAMKRG